MNKILMSGLVSLGSLASISNIYETTSKKKNKTSHKDRSKSKASRKARRLNRK